MIRWKYLAPRVVVLALVLLFMHYGTGPLMRLVAIQGGQMSLGSRVELGPVRALLLSGQVQIRGSQIADPKRPMHNLFEFASSSLQLDSQALMRRRLVVEKGRTAGVRFNTRREKSGSLKGGSAQDQATSKLGEKVGAMGAEWLSGVGDRMQTQLEEDLHSVKLARELSERWPVEYQQLERRVETWKTRIEQLQQMIDNPPRDPLRLAQQYQQGIGEVDRMLQELPLLKNEILRLRGQADRDRVALQQARQHDTDYLQQRMQIKSLDREELTEYLIGEELQGRINQLTGWLNRGRQFAGPLVGEGGKQQVPTGRGRTFSFDVNPEPDFLIRQLALDGQLDMDAKAYGFEGVVRDLTHRPDQLGRPATLQLKGTGDAEFEMQVVLDYTKKNRKAEQIRFRCPNLVQPARKLGDTDKLAVDVSAGQADIWIALDVVDDELQGKIALQQPGVQLVPHVASSLGGKQLQQRLATALQDVRDLTVNLDLSGSVKKPSWKVQSSLGDQLTRGFNTAVADELAFRTQQLQSEADARVQQYVARFEGVVGQKQAELQNKLQIGEQTVQQFKQRLSSRLGLPANGLLNRLKFD